ncbi:hypothetical protein Tco_0860422 [Tanacetum coccineum]|uniref:Uncharacterized protein n=1 Tax=Tanacetum coccineum TaxID=301880 RepID=A0ABQ5BEX3_9ASTR
MTSESASALATTGVGSTSAPTIREIISTKSKKPSKIGKTFNLCIMTRPTHKKLNSSIAFHFLSVGSNTTLRNQIEHPHCEAKKVQKNQNSEAGQTSMARDGSVFRYDPDYLREQFAGLVIQRALPFNHFDHEQTTRVFQTLCNQEYTIHLDAKERKQDKCPLETPLDFEEGVFDDEVQQNKAIPLSDEEITLDASSEGTMSSGGPRIAPDYEASRTRGFVLRSLKLQSLASMGIQYPKSYRLTFIFVHT